jgi:hypothetical protein
VTEKEFLYGNPEWLNKYRIYQREGPKVHSDWDRGEFTKEWDRAMKQAGLEDQVHPVSGYNLSPEDRTLVIWDEIDSLPKDDRFREAEDELRWVQGDFTMTLFDADEETDVDDIWIHAQFEPSDEIPSLWNDIKPWLLLTAAISLFILYWSL